MFLHDFSFRPAEEVLAEITGGMAGHDMAAMGDAAMAGMDHSGMDISGGDMSGMDMSGMDMGGMVMDLNDFNFDAYLANIAPFPIPKLSRWKRVVVFVCALSTPPRPQRSGSTPACPHGWLR